MPYNIPTTMKAAQYNTFSEDVDKFEPVQVVEVAVPEVRKGTVLVKVVAAAANPIDWKVCAGMLKDLWSMTLPFTLGYDLAGTVAAVAPDVTDLAVGDSVFTVNWGQGKHDDESELTGGAFAQYVLIPASKLSKLPAGLDHKTAAASALVGTTAYQGLFEQLNVRKGTRVLVLGGAGAVGLMAVQLAKQAGAWVATTHSTRTAKFVQQLGADVNIDYTQGSWSDHPDLKDGVDVVFDTVGEDGVVENALKVLKPDGKFRTIAKFDATDYFFLLDNKAEVQDKVAQLLAQGKITLPISSEFDLTTEGVQAALQAQVKGKSMGKNIINVA